ncbi:MAG: hypothetical protein WBY44_14670 [Bryobacteraceae bacterium]
MKPLLLAISFSLIGSTGKIIDFDSATLGKMPPGWSAAMPSGGSAPKWQVLRDGSAPTQPYVFARTNDPANHSPVAIFDAVAVRDGDISVRLKPLTGHTDQAGGLVFRYRDAKNYYLARANALDNTVAVFKVENGELRPLCADVRHPIPANAWSILKVSVRGRKFQVYVNHRRVLETQDETFQNSGKVGLWTKGDAVTYFDDFRVYPK